MAFRSVSLPKAKKNYQLFLDALIKREILVEILDFVRENPVEVQEAINFTTFWGTTYTFTDKSAIEQAITQPQRFIGVNDREIESALSSMSNKEVLKLYIANELIPLSASKDLKILIPTYIKVADGGVGGRFKGSKRSMYTDLHGTDADHPIESMIGVPGTDIASLNAPIFAKFLTKGDETTPSYDKQVDINNFNNVFRTLINETFIDSDERLKTRKKELTPGVVEELLGDLSAEQSTVDLINATLARDVPELEDALEVHKPQKPDLTPFDFQCFLLENISKLVDQRESGQYQTDYKNIVKVATDGDPGNIINTIQHGNKTGSVKAFLDICPEIYGLLVPYIKISRLEYDNLGNIKTDNGKAVMREMPVPNFLTQDDISDILSGKEGRAGGAGIKSFSWSLQGVQPAEVDNNIKATLVMYFQSVNDFFNGMSSAGQETPNFLDLIINSPAVRKLKGKKSQNKDPTTKPCEGNLLKTQVHRNYDGANFRVKVCAGWATPPVKAITELVGADKAKNLIKAVDDSRVSLFLQMTQHQINFNQNGSLELTVDYQASLAGLLSGKTANIFDESKTELDEMIVVNQSMIEDLDNAAERRGAETDSGTEKKKAALEEIKTFRNRQRNVKYRKLLKKIYSSNKVHSISLNPNELTMKPYGELTPEERQARVKRREDNVTYEFANVTQLNQELLNSLNQNMAATGEDTAKIYSENATKTFDELTDQTKINIPFFYLGDLFDMVLEEIKANNKNASADGLKPLNFNFFMSDVEMIDPLQAFKVENLEELINCGYDLSDIVFLDSVAISDKTQNGIYRTMNIGDIPISLDAFQLWFKNNVIKKNRDNYFFLYFVKDVCRGLITQALSSHCFGKGLKFRQRFDAQPLTLARQEAKIANFRPNDSVSSTAVALAQASVSCDLDPADTELGLLLYPTDSNPKSLTGEYKDDIPRGIYHHYLGSSCGLVKQINFQREDQGLLRETRIQKEGALGAEQLRELYSANIELVGNTLYKNGMYIYINPSLLSADRASLDYLGLHGYYLVTGVESKVTPSGFDVSIRALHEGIEFRGNKLLPSQVNMSSYAGRDPEEGPDKTRRLDLKREDPPTVGYDAPLANLGGEGATGVAPQFAASEVYKNKEGYIPFFQRLGFGDDD